jgi:two-component system, response regulator RegA
MTKTIDLIRDECFTHPPDSNGYTLLIVDCNASLLRCLARAMQERGFEVITAGSVTEAMAEIESNAPAFALVGMRFDDGCGLDVVTALKRRLPDARAIIHTSYGSLATAVRAAKDGAVAYLTKPTNPDEIASVLLAPADGAAEPPQHPMSAERVRWEHIHNIYEQCGCNVSETARRLAMHRRTLQRILAKGEPR